MILLSADVKLTITFIEGNQFLNKICCNDKQSKGEREKKLALIHSNSQKVEKIFNKLKGAIVFMRVEGLLCLL